MAVVRNTPTLGLRGTWTINLPFTLTSNVLYKCIATRTFVELILDGIDVFNKYYSPLGLTEAKYKEDLDAGAVLCILYSDAGSVVSVPDTYINSYPGIGMANYGNIVLSAIMGPVNLSTNLDYLKSAMGDLISDTFGVVPNIYVDLIDNALALTAEQAAAIEAARQSAITNRTTPYAENLKLKQTVASLNAVIDALTKNKSS